MSSPYNPPPPPSGAPGAPGGQTSLGLASNTGAMLCYLLEIACCTGIILSIILLITEKENRFVKFHALQSLFAAIAGLILLIALRIVGAIFHLVLSTADLGLIAGLLNFGLGIVVLIIFAIIFVLAGIKANGGQWYKLPIIGNIAWNIVNK